MTAVAGHLAFDDVGVVAVGDRLGWRFGRCRRAADHKSRQDDGGEDDERYSPAAMSDRSSLALRYRGAYGRYWERVERSRPTSYWEQNLVAVRRQARRLLMRWLDPLSEQTVVDVGCGLGALSLQLARQGARVVGLDLLPRFSALPEPSLSFVVGDLRQPVAASGRFSAAILDEILEDYPGSERLDIVRATAEWRAERLLLVNRLTSGWGGWIDRSAVPSGTDPVDTVELYRGIHLETPYFLARRGILRRRNCSLELAEFTLSHQWAEV